MSHLISKQAFAMCRLRYFKRACAAATQRNQTCGSLSKTISSSIYYVCEQWRLWRDCENVHVLLFTYVLSTLFIWAGSNSSMFLICFVIDAGGDLHGTYIIWQFCDWQAVCSMAWGYLFSPLKMISCAGFWLFTDNNKGNKNYQSILPVPHSLVPHSSSLYISRKESIHCRLHYNHSHTIMPKHLHEKGKKIFEVIPMISHNP